MICRRHGSLESWNGRFQWLVFHAFRRSISGHLAHSRKFTDACLYFLDKLKHNFSSTFLPSNWKEIVRRTLLFSDTIVYAFKSFSTNRNFILFYFIIFYFILWLMSPSQERFFSNLASNGIACLKVWKRKLRRLSLHDKGGPYSECQGNWRGETNKEKRYFTEKLQRCDLWKTRKKVGYSLCHWESKQFTVELSSKENTWSYV